jgi:hypothetical protein
MSLAASELFCSDTLIHFPISYYHTLVFSKTKGRCFLISSEAARLLSFCSEFNSLDHHIDRFRQHSQHPNLELVVTDLLQKKLLVSSHTVFLESVSDQKSNLKKIETIGIITCDRYSSLQRSLESFAANCQFNDRAVEFAICDSSVKPENQQQIHQLLVGLKKSLNSKISYIGQSERIKFIQTLASRLGISSEIIGFAISDPLGCGDAIGANRNSLFLQCVDDLVLSCDDDIIGTVTPSPKFTGDLAVDSSNEFIDYYFFPDRESVLNQTEFCNTDILSIHESMLGQKATQLFSDSMKSGEFDFRHLSSWSLSRVLENDAEIPITLTGFCGDSGTPTPQPYMLLNGDSRNRFLEQYKVNNQSREIMRVARRGVVTDNIWGFMTTSLAYDCRSLLPPFLPIARGEDSLFAIIFRECMADKFFGHLPWALLHSPPEPRLYEAGGFVKSADSITLVSVIAACISSCNIHMTTRNNGLRMKLVGKHLMEVGALKVRDFEEFLRLNLSIAKCGYAAALENQINSFEFKPDFWAQDIRAYQENLYNSISNNDNVAPIEMITKFGIEHALAITQKIILNYGQLLCTWESIVEAARTLRNEGVRIGTNL